MFITPQDISGMINVSNFAYRFNLDLSIARTAVPLGLIISSKTKVNGLYILSKGTGSFTLTFAFPIKGSEIGLSELYFYDHEVKDNTALPYEFKDIVITNTAQTGVTNPTFIIGLFING